MSDAAQKDDTVVIKEEVLKDAAPERLLRIRLELEDERVCLNAAELKYFIVSGLRSLYGEVGAALNFDLLNYDEVSGEAFLRVSKEALVKLWSSLTLLGSYQNLSCAFRVLQVTPADSRELQQD